MSAKGYLGRLTRASGTSFYYAFALLPRRQREAIFALYAFSRGLGRYGTSVGGFFAPVQSGVYRSPLAARIAGVLAAEGHYGIAQSSWGPTICIACPDAATAEQVAAFIQQTTGGDRCSVSIAAPLNSAARLALN